MRKTNFKYVSGRMQEIAKVYSEKLYDRQHTLENFQQAQVYFAAKQTAKSFGVLLSIALSYDGDLTEWVIESTILAISSKNTNITPIPFGQYFINLSITTKGRNGGVLVLEPPTDNAIAHIAIVCMAIVKKEHDRLGLPDIYAEALRVAR